MGWPRAIVHLDLDAFYASVEQLRRPELRGRPVIVGGAEVGQTSRGVVSAASYEARRFGVRSAMPLGRARRLCPEAVCLPVDFPAYRRASAAVFGLARQVTPLVEPLSLDEAHLDITATPGDPGEIAARLRDRILDETGLHASFGVATSKTVAKIASELRKPRGFVVVPPGTEAEFLAPLPLRALPGLGPSTERALSGLGLRDLGDLGRHPVSLLEARVGRAAALSLHRRSQGIDPSPVTVAQSPRSISREETFAADTDDRDLLRQRLRELCADVGRSLRRAGLSARTVSLKLRFDDFTTLARQLTLEAGSDSDAVISAGALALLEGAHPPGRLVRLLGAGVSHLEPAAQLDLFATPGTDRDRRVDAALDALERRFGPRAVHRGAATGVRDLDWHREDLGAPPEATG